MKIKITWIKKMKLIIIGVGSNGQVIKETVKETNKYCNAKIVLLDD